MHLSNTSSNYPIAAMSETVYKAQNKAPRIKCTPRYVYDATPRQNVTRLALESH